ncbi:MAG TPA: type II toxin-antitoxin system VapC family toxin [Acidimicrobiales bacterium]|nr:type II toxin-antitoxin system VapC family toxin [Acidimicrobiales bacterium]
MTSDTSVIIDTSAIIAILRAEPDADRYVDAVARATGLRLSAGTYLETAIVVDANHDPVLSGRFDDLVTATGAKVEPVTPEHAEIARRAYRDFGRGSGHPAGLNFGDCFAYALARATGSPLLYKGDDFSRTDVISALGNTGLY